MNNFTPINSAGLRQQDRGNPALKPDFVSVDNRSSLDIIRACNLLADQVGFSNFLPSDPAQQQALVNYIERIQQFADETAGLEDVAGTTNSNDRAFEATPGKTLAQTALSGNGITSVQPHMQLFLTFLQLLKHPQKQFDQLTARHMNFYYQQVLKFQHQPAVPDSVYLTFELEQGVESCLLEKGCLLSAPGEHDKQPLLYALDRPLEVNQATISEIRQIPPRSQIVNIQFDERRDNKIEPFYVGEQSSPRAQYSMSTLYLESSLLKLQEGDRTITIDWSDSDVAAGNLERIEISTANGWKVLEPVPEGGGATGYEVKNNQLIIALDRFFPPLTTPPLVGETFTDPVIKFVPKEGECLQLDSVSLSVEVKGLKDLILENEQGVFKNNATFDLFGFEPSQGACLYFSNQEICNKPLEKLTLNTEWVPGAVPNDGSFPNINKIYEYYPGQDNTKIVGEAQLGRADIKVEVKVDGDFIKTFKTRLNICGSNGQVKNLCEVTELFSPLDFEFNNVSSPEPSQDVVSYQLILSQGDFLYQQYLVAQNHQAEITAQINTNQSLMAAYLMELAALLGKQEELQNIDDLLDGLSSKIEKLEKNNKNLQAKLGTIYPPYTPALRPLSVDYKTSKSGFELKHFSEIGLLKPWESNEFSDGSEDSTTKLLLKLTGVTAGQQVSLLVQISCYYPQALSQSAGNSDQSGCTNEVKALTATWEYCKQSDGTWEDIKPNTPYELNSELPSGNQILIFTMPDKLGCEEDNDSVWLKANITGTEQWPDIQVADIRTQAVQASYVIPAQGEQRDLSQPLPPNSINSFVIQQPEIRTITQPFPSFSGQEKQTNQQLAVVASERLSNRQRALTVTDYESLILEKFPEVEEVRCLTANQLRTPGCVDIQIIVKRHSNLSVDERVYPMADYKLLVLVKRYIQSFCSPFVKINVSNPELQPVQAYIDVEFSNIDREGFYIEKLQEDITQILGGQLLKANSLPSFGKRPSESELRSILNRKAYIKRIVYLSLSSSDSGLATASVYVPAVQHQVNQQGFKDVEI